MINISGYVLALGFLAGLMTGLGGLIAILIKKIDQAVISSTLGFAAGVMVGISTLSLIPNSLDNGGLLTCVFGFVLGGIFLFILDIKLPHVHKIETEEKMYYKMGIFIALGIALHNIPEGLAVGVSGHISTELSFYTALGIGLHNVAEGLCVAVPLALGKLSKFRVVLISTLTGLSTLIGALGGLILGSISVGLVSVSLAFAAGAMIYITSDELIPQSHYTHSEFANIGIMLGFIFSLLLP